MNSAMISASLVPDRQTRGNGNFIKKKSRRSEERSMKSNYDFSEAIRGKSTRRYAKGANVVIVGARVRQSIPYFEGSEFFSAKDHSGASLGIGPVTIATSLPLTSDFWDAAGAPLPGHLND